MIYSSTPSGRPSDYYMAGSFVGGVIFWAVSGRAPFPAMWQLLAVVLIAAAVYILCRYRLTVFRLAISSRDDAAEDVRLLTPGEIDFTVERMRGKNPQLLCRLALSELREVRRITDGDCGGAAKEMSLYRYNVNMSPESGALAVFESAGERISIFAEMPEEMILLFEKAAAENREFDEF